MSDLAARMQIVLGLPGRHQLVEIFGRQRQAGYKLPPLSVLRD